MSETASTPSAGAFLPAVIVGIALLGQIGARAPASADSLLERRVTADRFASTVAEPSVTAPCPVAVEAPRTGEVRRCASRSTGSG
jgi:hypothetical protein